MKNNLMLAMLNLLGRDLISDMVDRNILNEDLKLCEAEIMNCFEQYKRLNQSFEVPSFEDIKKSIDEASIILLKSEELGIKCINIFDERFPKRFKEIKEKSLLIFYKGDLDCLNQEKCIAIIGTRTPSENGRKKGELLGKFYSEQGFVVVSGLAIGCDTSAHIGCLKNKGKTVAIMPCGLDKCYPSGNEELEDEIISNGGCVLSEYTIGTYVSANNFVQRDRLQAALSLGVLVIECGIDSGTSKTVGFAQKYNKKIAVSLHDEVYGDCDTVKGNLYFIKNKNAIGIKDLNDCKKYVDILLN